MQNIEVHLIKAFTKNPSEGNPAGVIFDTDDFSEDLMIKISAKLGFSESAFISKSEKADFKIRFFSPKQEVNLCAHATIAAVHALKEAKQITKNLITQETKIGLLEVESSKDGLIFMTQAKPEFVEYEIDQTEVANLLGLEDSDIENYPLKIVSTGTPKLMIPIKTLQSVLKIQPDLEGIKEYCQKSGARGFYPFTFETKSKESEFHARQFNPLAGINEDPVTGIAAGALGAYIRDFKLLPKTRFIIEQGYSMNKPGQIFVDTTIKSKSVATP